ncbi:uncharacterized protein LOC118437656 [Folsomia candida]|uniref:uncharacterized protein LOC118437656 n=1 Tax=Folsomia candida TaxID=158441 RepID=UPI001604CE30|nr:uncharacterized protein LOC118437656 [Folsomia candida]
MYTIGHLLQLLVYFDHLVARVEKAFGNHFKSTCTITRWTNVYFCKKCDNFNLHNHIKLNKESDPAKLAEFLNSQISKRFLVGQPLWEIISLPNYTHAKYSTSSAIVIRVHHTIECRSLLYLHNAGIMRPGSRHGRKYCPTLKKYQEKVRVNHVAKNLLLLSAHFYYSEATRILLFEGNKLAKNFAARFANLSQA